MLKFTSTYGTAIEVHPPSVLRIRKALPSENQEAVTRIDSDQLALVIEDVEVVAEVVGAEVPTLTRFNVGKNDLEGPVWINAARVSRAVPPSPNAHPKFNSLVRIGAIEQHLIESIDVANAILDAARKNASKPMSDSEGGVIG